MGTLWTPEGEHEVPPTAQPDQGGAPSGTATGETPAGADAETDISADTLRAAAASIGVDLDALDDAEKDQLRAELAEMMRVRREVAATPAAEMLANHMMRLFDLTTIYLEGDPPSFSDASTVIEAFRAVLERLGDRLGDSEQPLTEALGQLQMLFVQVKDAKAGSTGT
ncbi:MAG: hypothetical protein H6517_01725 [Microthrixaceae bacterium]|nr:hypothetical protein [Microthrixaceae bacterium]MCB1010035.1 hypothetical protein [Microthrixaceae bacterium]MCB9386530.1 hypothetical protein [Microthrixaceae bacterium]MCO5320100.1 hypothetical protein [Microthrixaceae bacterium]